MRVRQACFAYCRSPALTCSKSLPSGGMSEGINGRAGASQSFPLTQPSPALYFHPAEWEKNKQVGWWWRRIQLVCASVCQCRWGGIIQWCYVPLPWFFWAELQGGEESVNNVFGATGYEGARAWPSSEQGLEGKGRVERPCCCTGNWGVGGRVGGCVQWGTGGAEEELYKLQQPCCSALGNVEPPQEWSNPPLPLCSLSFTKACSLLLQSVDSH